MQRKTKTKTKQKNKNKKDQGTILYGLFKCGIRLTYAPNDDVKDWVVFQPLESDGTDEFWTLCPQFRLSRQEEIVPLSKIITTVSFVENGEFHLLNRFVSQKVEKYQPPLRILDPNFLNARKYLSGTYLLQSSEMLRMADDSAYEPPSDSEGEEDYLSEASEENEETEVPKGENVNVEDQLLENGDNMEEEN